MSLISRSILLKLIWDYIVCLCPTRRTLGLYGLKMMKILGLPGSIKPGISQVQSKHVYTRVKSQLVLGLNIALLEGILAHLSVWKE